MLTAGPTRCVTTSGDLVWPEPRWEEPAEWPGGAPVAGRRVGVRIDPATLAFFDPETRQLLRTRPNPLTSQQIIGLRGARPAGPPPQPSTEPVRVQRRASNSGVVMVAWQKVALGRVHAGKTVAITVSETELTVECDDGPRTIRRTNNHPVTRIKAHRPRKVALDG